jgi:DNA invertase Pin-like site-specific DNA recombinase
MREQQHSAAARVAIYARFSTANQKETSIEDQVRRCQEFSARQGWGEVPDERVFTDSAVSGGSADRQAYQDMMAAIRAGNGHPPFTVLLVDNLARLSRDLGEVNKWRKLLPRRGIRLLSVMDGLDTARPGARLEMGLRGLMSDEYRAEVGGYVRRGLEGQFLKNFHCGGRKYGFASEPVADPSGARDRDGNPVLLGHRLRRHPTETDVFLRMARDCLAGLRPRHIAAALTAEGIPTPTAGFQRKTDTGQARRTLP